METITGQLFIDGVRVRETLTFPDLPGLMNSFTYHEFKVELEIQKGKSRHTTTREAVPWIHIRKYDSQIEQLRRYASQEQIMAFLNKAFEHPSCEYPKIHPYLQHSNTAAS